MKSIKDLVHGYIELSTIAASIVDTVSFQRLKHISQLTAVHLYPSANHSRFEHSLGVMHLASLFFIQLKDEIIAQCEETNYFSNVPINEKIKELGCILQVAALLHDVGHAPLSHVGEFFYDKKEIRQCFENQLKESNIHLDSDTVEEMFNSGSPHELMSCYVILKNYSNVLIKTIKLSDFSLLFRIITGAKYRKDWLKNLLISIVNSNGIDVDKLDYLMRDNFMTGYVGPKINIDRLIKSACLDNRRALVFTSKGMSSVLSVVESRDWLYLWVYNHHTTVYTDFLYQDCMRHFNNLFTQYPGLYQEEANLQSLFSCSAISDKMMTDHNVHTLLYSNIENLNCSKNITRRTHKLLNQIIHRKFLKPLWKSLYEYSQFMDKHNFSTADIDDFSKHINENREIRSAIIKEIIETCNIEDGDVFLVCRSNKFYFMDDKSKIFITFGEDKKPHSLTDVFPQRSYSEHYDKVNFYLFCCRKKYTEIQAAFIDILRNQSYLDYSS